VGRSAAALVVDRRRTEMKRCRYVKYALADFLRIKRKGRCVGFTVKIPNLVENLWGKRRMNYEGLWFPIKLINSAASGRARGEKDRGVQRGPRIQRQLVCSYCPIFFGQKKVTGEGVSSKS